ncbi:MAG TPA: hypothetical protein GXX36_01010 [Clostridiaceae bacterium]|nr:hypothetical protein [Clostridiaceae bacterium]
MKKFISGLFVGIILMLAITASATGAIKEAWFNKEIKLEVDGKTVNTDMVTVILEGDINGTNYVSARALAEALGAKVEWDGKNKKILVISKDEANKVKDDSNTVKDDINTMKDDINEGEQAAQYKYLGSAESNKYHLPSCRFAKEIAEKNLVKFKDKADAESKGYEPCGVCKP